jgi:hypothetical protein
MDDLEKYQLDPKNLEGVQGEIGELEEGEELSSPHEDPYAPQDLASVTADIDFEYAREILPKEDIVSYVRTLKITDKDLQQLVKQYLNEAYQENRIQSTTSIDLVIDEAKKEFKAEKEKEIDTKANSIIAEAAKLVGQKYTEKEIAILKDFKKELQTRAIVAQIPEKIAGIPELGQAAYEMKKLYQELDTIKFL